MRKLLLSIALCAMALSSQAQVSYTEMRNENTAATPRYITPASLTPLQGTDKFMNFDGENVLL